MTGGCGSSPVLVNADNTEQLDQLPPRTRRLVPRVRLGRDLEIDADHLMLDSPYPDQFPPGAPPRRGLTYSRIDCEISRGPLPRGPSGLYKRSSYKSEATSGPLTFFTDFLIGSRARLQKIFTMNNSAAIATAATKTADDPLQDVACG